MILIFGGAYQGKTDYARNKFGVKDIFSCAGGAEPDFDAECLIGIEEFVMECVKNGTEAKEFFAGHEEEWKDSVLVITDMSQGVVPTDGNLRAAREMNGRLMLYLADKAEQVHRVFCGIGKRIK